MGSSAICLFGFGSKTGAALAELLKLQAMAIRVHLDAPAGRRKTTGTSSKRSCGGGERACRGETYRNRLALGRQCSIASTVGPRRENGRDCSRRSKPTSTRNGKVSIVQSTAHTNTLPAAKGGGAARNRPIARRPDNESTHGG